MTKQLGPELRSDVAAGVAMSRRAVLQAGGATAIAASGLARAGSAFATPAIAAFTYQAPQSALDDLRQRLERARWPEREPVADWSQGVPLARLRALVEYWRTDYDWRRCEAQLNGFDQYRTEIDGLGIHFLHVRSPHADALPIVITHGWPGSVIEFFKIIDPLTNPTAHGGEAQDAFHVVAPSLPGFGFSDRPAERGWNAERIARAWAELMRRLGYDRYVAQGGDWGSLVTTEMARQRPAGLAAHPSQHAVRDSGPGPDRRAVRRRAARRRCLSALSERWLRLLPSPGDAPADDRLCADGLRRSGRPPGSTRSSRPGPTMTAPRKMR